jgi:hypothetical protein
VKSQNPVFFIDRALGRRHVPKALRELGYQVEIHDDHFPSDAPDADWIPVVAQKGWLILSKDEKIAYRTLESQAVARYRAQMFILVSGNLSGDAMAIAFQRAAKSMHRFAMEQPAPFIAKVYKDGTVKAWKSDAKLRQ